MRRALRSVLAAFRRDVSAAIAVEFAFVALPFILLLFGVLQVGLYYSFKMQLDNGVQKEAEALQKAFSTGTTPTLPTASQMKASVTTYAGTLINNQTVLAVEVQPLQNLDTASVAISDGLASYGSAHTVLAIRASYTVPQVLPIGPTPIIYSSALVRRQNQ